MDDDTHSFVVRIWHEAVDDEGQPTAWRGYVDDIGSGERFHFHELSEIGNLIAQQIGSKTKSRPRWHIFLAKIRREMN